MLEFTPLDFEALPAGSGYFAPHVSALKFECGLGEAVNALAHGQALRDVHMR